MPYHAQFGHADDVMANLTEVVPAIVDPLLQAKYAGFAAVAAVTVYEMALKQIVFDFAEAQNPILGTFSHTRWDRINGRIKLCHIRDDYLRSFGQVYVDKFNDALAIRGAAYLKLNGHDIEACYTNLILWRHDFVHKATVATTATFAEVVMSYDAGKEVLACVFEALR
jgi:hypothetical protein